MIDIDIIDFLRILINLNNIYIYIILVGVRFGQAKALIEQMLSPSWVETNAKSKNTIICHRHPKSE